jgi:hypothetical protein
MGQNARLGLARERDFAYCALTNVANGGAVLAAGQLWAFEHLLGITAPPPLAPAPLPLDAATLATYAAAYDNPGEQICWLSVRDDGLELVVEGTDPLFTQMIQPPLPPEPPMRLAFSAPDELYGVEAPRARGAFLRHPDGRIAGLFWGARFYARR